MTEAQQQHRDPQTGMTTADIESCVADLVNVFDKGMADEVEPYDLSSVEFGILRTCMQRGECTATQLADILPIDAPRVSRMVNRLVNMGLLHRRRLQDDRRVVMLRLTQKGNELTLEIEQRVRQYDAKMIEGISEEEMRVFAATTSKILANYTALEQSG